MSFFLNNFLLNLYLVTSLLCVSLWLLSAAPLLAASDGLGSTSGGFLKRIVGPRPAGFGGAFAGVADDVNAIGYNPAGLAILRRHEATLMHNELMTDVRQEWLAAALAGERWGTLALSAHVIHVQPFKIYDGNDSPAGEVSSQDSAYGISYAKNFGGLSLGVTGKWLHSRLHDISADSYCFDVGALYDTPFKGLRAGLAAVNMGEGLKYIGDTDVLPMGGRAGISYTLHSYEQREGRDHQLTGMIDMTAYRDQDAFASLGVEYIRHSVLAFRAGWSGDNAADNGLTLGAGVYINRRGRAKIPEIDFDYAWVKFGELGTSHRVSVTVKFGSQKWLKVEEEAPKSALEIKKKKPQRKVKPAPEPARTNDSLLEPLNQDKIWVNP